MHQLHAFSVDIMSVDGRNIALKHMQAGEPDAESNAGYDSESCLCAGKGCISAAL